MLVIAVVDPFLLWTNHLGKRAYSYLFIHVKGGPYGPVKLYAHRHRWRLKFWLWRTEHPIVVSAESHLDRRL